jgi:hypothetical protein
VPQAEREAGPGEECQGDREFHGPVGKDVQQQDTYGDHHGHGERRGRAQPDGEGTARVAMTREASMFLSGSSPRKITGKTAATTARFALALCCAAAWANLASAGDSAAGLDD